MFTDSQATPIRLEILIDLLNEYSVGLKRDAIYDLLQPPSLSEGSHNAAQDTLGAALQLGLIEENKKIITLSKEYDEKKSSKENILKTCDDMVLSRVDIEYHLALFYAYYLGQNNTVSPFPKRVLYEEWANNFNRDVFKNKTEKNKFNPTKINGLIHWLGYLGLGWYDSNDDFHANPYERLLRVIPIIFEKETKMEIDPFMSKLGKLCPELDGGSIFIKANEYKNYKTIDKQCTLGLSHALIELHEDEVIRLYCPVDSRGWNIGIAQPPRDDTIKQDRITLVEYIGR